jgi:hypothetical protein
MIGPRLRRSFPKKVGHPVAPKLLVLPAAPVLFVEKSPNNINKIEDIVHAFIDDIMVTPVVASVSSIGSNTGVGSQ